MPVGLPLISPVVGVGKTRNYHGGQAVLGNNSKRSNLQYVSGAGWRGGGGGHVLPYIRYVGMYHPYGYTGMVFEPFWSENGYI